MGEHRAICRLGVFYDGSFFSYARNYYYHERQLGWLRFPELHRFLEKYIGLREQGVASKKLFHPVLRIVPAHYSCGLRGYVNLAAEIVESAHEPQDGFGAVTAGEVIGAEIAVREAVFQHVIGGGEHGGSDGEDGLFGSSA